MERGSKRRKRCFSKCNFPSFRKLHIKGGLVSVDLHPVCLAPRAKRTSRGRASGQGAFLVGMLDRLSESATQNG